MNAAIFVGPTVTVTEARSVFDCAYHAPAKQGDVRRLVREGIEAVGIIDGQFHSVRSVWHKEILCELDEGVHVFGSASIGALRAAELHVFGMVGVGKVFEMYRDGVLEDDDEVAVIHAPAEQDYVATSVAMVNIRATLAAAVEENVLPKAIARELEEAAKQLYFPHRTYDILLERLPANHRSAFREWLPKGQVDLKRSDAIAMLTTMKELEAANPGKKEVQFFFEHRETFRQAESK